MLVSQIRAFLTIVGCCKVLWSGSVGPEVTTGREPRHRTSEARGPARLEEPSECPQSSLAVRERWPGSGGSGSQPEGDAPGLDPGSRRASPWCSPCRCTRSGAIGSFEQSVRVVTVPLVSMLVPHGAGFTAKCYNSGGCYYIRIAAFGLYFEFPIVSQTRRCACRRGSVPRDTRALRVTVTGRTAARAQGRCDFRAVRPGAVRHPSLRSGRRGCPGDLRHSGFAGRTYENFPCLCAEPGLERPLWGWEPVGRLGGGRRWTPASSAHPASSCSPGRLQSH